MSKKLKKHLFILALLTRIRNIFDNLPQISGNRKKPITLTDCLMSALAMFGLKYPSLTAI